ncbi:MAG: glycine betaine ABC transporter substrate-binding protein [Acidimicrobiales bacterium]
MISSPAADQNGYGVSQAPATKYHLTSLSQISSLASQWVFGGPPECRTRPKHIAPVDNITGLIRSAKSTPAVDAIINKVDAALTTDELRSLNEQIGVQKADPATLAQQFDAQHGLT